MVEHANTDTSAEYRFDPFRPADMLGLDDSITTNRKIMQPHIEQYKEFLEQFVGFHYSDHGSEKHLPVNYVEMLVTILGRHLVAEHPRVMVTTDKPKLKPAAYEMTLAGDKRIKELNVKKALQDATKAAFFGLGIAKVGTEIDGQVQIHGEPRDVVHPWVDWIDLDDIVLDMSAKAIRDTTFVAQRFTIPLARQVKGWPPPRRRCAACPVCSAMRIHGETFARYPWEGRHGKSWPRASESIAPPV